MATFNGSTSRVAINMNLSGPWSLPNTLETLATPLHSSTQWQESLSNGYSGTADGINLTYFAESFGGQTYYWPDSGTFTGFTLRDAGGNVIFSISGASISVEQVGYYTEGGGGGWSQMLASVFSGADLVKGGNKADNLFGFGGNDTLAGGAGNDKLNGGIGIDTVDYAADRDLNADGLGVVVNLAPSTVLASGTWAGVTYASVNAGTAIDGRGGVDTLTAFENVRGSAFNDVIFGNGAANTLNGGLGSDLLVGALGADTLLGGDGNDKLVGGVDNDMLTGGTGNDMFKFITADGSTDSITDFTSGTDKIQVVAANFGLTAGATVTLIKGATLPAASGTGAQFLYNSTTGALYFDQDGTASAFAATQIATLSGPKRLTAADIQVVAS